MATTKTCAWCKDPDTDYEPADPEAELCRWHLAEYEGTSVAGLDRQDEEEAEELFWRYH